MSNLILDRRSLSAWILALAACGRESPRTASSSPAPSAQTPPGPRVSDSASLQALLDEQVKESGVPGIAAAVFNISELKLIAASGVRVAGSPGHVTTGDLWHLGSCTKAMTAALYARLVEQGRAKWGATLGDLFPELAKSFDPAFAAAPIDAVLRHRAGLGDFEDAAVSALFSDKRALRAQRAEIVRNFLTKPPAKQSGEFSYSNAGYVIAGAAIERITDKPWENAIREHVFDPLKIEAAGFGPPEGDQPQGHVEDSSGAFKSVGTGPEADNPPAIGPAGRVHMTLEDWAKFVRIFMDPAPTFLSADSIARLSTPEPGQDYAFGWLALKHPVAGSILAHTGSNNMWMAQAIVLKEHHAALVTAMNAAGPRAQKAHRAIGDALTVSIAETLIK